MSKQKIKTLAAKISGIAGPNVVYGLLSLVSSYNAKMMCFEEGILELCICQNQQLFKYVDMALL